MLISQWNQVRENLHINPNEHIYICDNCGAYRGHYREAKRSRLKCPLCNQTGFFYPVQAPPRKQLDYVALEQQLRDYALILGLKVLNCKEKDMAVFKYENRKPHCVIPENRSPK